MSGGRPLSPSLVNYVLFVIDATLPLSFVFCTGILPAQLKNPFPCMVPLLTDSLHQTSLGQALCHSVVFGFWQSWFILFLL